MYVYIVMAKDGEGGEQIYDVWDDEIAAEEQRKEINGYRVEKYRIRVKEK